MLTARVDQQSRTVILMYPSFAKKKQYAVKVRSYDEAATVLRIRTLKFISNEIRAFVNSRAYIYDHTGTMTKSRQKAINHLRFVLDNYSEGAINRLANRIRNSRLSFAELMPTRPSKAKTYFDNHIIPIIQYCTDYEEAQA